MIRNFNTGYYYKGIVIMDRIKIAKRYAGKILFFDFIALVSQIAAAFLGQYILSLHWVFYYGVKMIVFLRISSFINSRRRLSNFFNTKPKLQEWISIFKLIAYLLLLAHIVAIMFHGLGQYEMKWLEYNNTWLHQARIQDDDWKTRYLNSIFWATGSMVQVILFNPNTLEETIFINVILLINCLVFGYTINTLGDILKDINKDKKGLNQEINIMNRQIYDQITKQLNCQFQKQYRYLNMRQVSSNLKIKIRNYLEYMNKNVLTKNQDEENFVIKKLSNALQDELKREVNFKRIKLFTPIFSHFSQTILYNLLLKIQEINITPNEQIIKSGTLDDCSIYVVSAGEIQISMKREDDFYGSTQNEEKIIKILKKGEIFGEVSFFTGEARKATAKSVDFGQLYKIARKDFIQLLQGRSLDEEKFAVLKDSLLFYKQFEKISLKCYICQSQTHLSTDLKRKVLLPELRNKEQDRDKDYKRLDRKHRMSSINTLQLQKDCWIALEQFIQHNFEEIDQYESEYQINDYSMTFDEDEDIQNLLHQYPHNIIEYSGDEDTHRNETQYNPTGRVSVTGNAQHQSQQNQNISPKIQNKRVSEHKSPKTPTAQHISPKIKRQSSLTQHQSPKLQHQSPPGQQQSQSLIRQSPQLKRKSLLFLNKSPPIQHRQQGIYSMNQIPAFQQWLPNKMQQVTEGKNFHDYIELFNKEMRIQQRTTSNHNIRKQASMQMASILKEMNKQRQGPHTQLKKQLQGSDDIPAMVQATAQLKSYEKTGDFLIPDDIQQHKSTQKSEFSQQSQPELSSQYASDSDDEKNLTDENKKTIYTINKHDGQFKQDNIIETDNKKYNQEDDEKQQSSSDLFVDEQVDQQIQLPSINPNLNLQSHDLHKQDKLKQDCFKKDNLQQEEQILKTEKENKNNQQQFMLISKQKEQVSPNHKKRNLSQSAQRTNSSQQIIHQEDKYRKPSIGYLNQEGIQVSIDCSSPSQATLNTSNMRGLSHKKIPNHLDERRISNLSSINAKRDSKDSNFFKQANIPYILNSPYFQSPKNINGFNFALPYMDQTQLSAIIEDYDLIDEKIDKGEINPQIFFAFQKKPDTNLFVENINSPQFNQMQYRQSIRSNSIYNQNQTNFPIIQARNYPSFSSTAIPQNGFYQSFEYHPQQTSQSPQSNKTLLASKNMKWADIRRKSMFANMHSNSPSTQKNSPSIRNYSPSIRNHTPSTTNNNSYNNTNNLSINYNNSPSMHTYQSEQQIQFQQKNGYSQQLKNILPQQIFEVQNNELQQMQQIGPIHQYINTMSKQNSNRKRMQSMKVNNEQPMYPTVFTHNKRQSILKNPSKFGQTNISQLQSPQINSSQINYNNSPLQQAINQGLVNHLSQGYNLMQHHQAIYRPSQQLNIHAMKLEQQYMDQNLQIYDVMKLFKLYFILGNYDVILAKIEQQRKKSNKKPQNLGQIRRFFTRNQKEKTLSSFKMQKSYNPLHNSSNPSQNLLYSFNPSQNLSQTQKLNPTQYLNPSLNPQQDQSIDFLKKNSFISQKQQTGDSLGINLPLNKIKSEMY